MNYIIKNINKNSQITFFLLIFYGLSFSIFFKELNLIFFKNFDLHFLTIYRVLIILFSFSILFSIKKKINFISLLLVFLNIIFLYNSFFGEKIYFKIDSKIFYHALNVKYDLVDIFFTSKNKILLINSLNILLPLLFLIFCKKLSFKIEEFKSLSIRICNLFLYSFSIFLIYKFILIKFEFIEYQEAFINIHSLIYILNIYFLLIIDTIKKNRQKLNFQNIKNIFLIFFCFLISGTSIHFLICLISLIIYFINKKKYLIFFLILFFLLSLIFQNELFNNNNQILSIIDPIEPGTLLNSIYIRIMTIKYFLLYPENLNLILGNNIFVDNIYTYPHNFFIDILITTGLTGIIIIFLILVNFAINLKYNKNNNLFIFTLLFQLFIFSNLSGFFFTNIILNIAFAASFCFLKENDSAIIQNS